MEIFLCIGANGKAFTADGEFVAMQSHHVFTHGLVTGEYISNLFSGHAGLPVCVFQTLGRAGVHTFLTAAASAFCDRFVRRQGCICQNHRHAEGAAELFRNKDTAFADPAQTCFGCHSFVGQGGGAQ